MWTPLRKAPRLENRLWEELRVWGRSHSLARSQIYSAELGDGSPPSRPQSYSDPRRAQGSHWTQHQEYPQVTYRLEGWSPGLRSLLAVGTPSRCSLLARGRMPRHLATPCQDRAFGQAHPRSVLRPGCWAEDKDPTSFQIRLQTKKRVMEFTNTYAYPICVRTEVSGAYSLPPGDQTDQDRKARLHLSGSPGHPNTPLNHPTDIYCTLCIPGTMESSGDLPMSKAALMPALPKAAVPQGGVYLPTNHRTRHEGREKDQWTAAHSGSPGPTPVPCTPRGHSMACPTS